MHAITIISTECVVTNYRIFYLLLIIEYVIVTIYRKDNCFTGSLYFRRNSCCLYSVTVITLVSLSLQDCLIVSLVMATQTVQKCKR